MHISLFPYHYAFISPSVLSRPLSRPQIEPNQSHLIKQMPEVRINTGFRHFSPLFKLPIYLTQMLNIFGFSLYLTTVFICFSRYIFIFMCNRYNTGITLVSPQQILLIPSHHPRGDLKICFFAIFIL